MEPDSPDAADELDLTPRRLDDIPRGRKLGPGLILVVVLAVIGFALFQGLSGATLSLNQANEAVSQRDDLGERRFRLLGSPIALTEGDFELDGSAAARFTIACDGIAVDVIHRGNVAESFQMGVPVVLEGQWTQNTDTGTAFEDGANDGWYFDSDLMLVKHDNDYRTDRVEEAASCGGDEPDAPS